MLESSVWNCSFEFLFADQIRRTESEWVIAKQIKLNYFNLQPKQMWFILIFGSF